MTAQGVCALLLLVTTGACATSHVGLADRFITHGTPAIDYGGPRVSLPWASKEALTRAPSVSESRQPRPATSTRAPLAATLESTSARLQRALIDVAASGTSEAYLHAAHAYLAEGIPDSAFDYLSEGLARDRRSPALHDAMARLWRDWGLFDYALTSAHTAVYLAPQSAEARNTLGTVLWKLGRRPQAGRAFREATALAPDAWYAWQNLCQVDLAAGDTRAATAACQQATRTKLRVRRTRP